MELIVQIQKNFAKICKAVSVHNTKNIDDAAIYTESLIKEILNLIYGWSLENVNAVNPRNPVFDLQSTDKKILVQVTTRNPNSLSKKISKVITEKASQTTSAVYFFSLMGFPQGLRNLYDSPLLLDVKTILSELRNRDIETQKQVNQRLLQALDSSWFSAYVNQLFDSDFEVSLDIKKGYYSTTFVHGLGRVRLTANIPMCTNEHFSCVLNFGKHSIKEASITFDEARANEWLFSGYHKPFSERNMIADYSESNDFSVLQFGGVLIFSDIDVAQQLCKLADELYEVYSDCKKFVILTIGAEEYSVKSIENPCVHLMNINNRLWKDIVQFANAHPINKNGMDWDIFFPYNSAWQNYLLRISSDGGFSIACQIKRIPIPDADECELYWESGYTWRETFEESYKAKKLWKVDYTYTWLNTVLIPYVKTYTHAEKKKTILELFKR